MKMKDEIDIGVSLYTDEFDDNCMKFAILMDDAEVITDLLKYKSFSLVKKSAYMLACFCNKKNTALKAFWKYLINHEMVPLTKYTEGIIVNLYKNMQYSNVCNFLKALGPFVEIYGCNSKVIDTLKNSSIVEVADSAMNLINLTKSHSI